MSAEQFKLHDVSKFPIVRLSGRSLPPGYGPTWEHEVEMLLNQGKPFAFVFLDSVENEAHDDQKIRMVWLKANKERLAGLCRGIFSVEPNRAMRIAKRAQGLVVAVAFGLKFRIAATSADAERLAAIALAGHEVPEDAEAE